MRVSENHVLQPRDSSCQSSDNWPQFALNQVKVISQRTGDPISLLSAHKGNPVKVTGQLEEVDDDQVCLVRDPSYTNLTIELTDVTTYAFAEFKGGGYGFWAAGRAGWFEVAGTSPAYKPIYDEMDVAASMLYFLADKIRKSRKAGFTTSQYNAHIKRLFRDYFAIGRYPTRFADAEDVREGFDEHREFLIASMLEGQEGLNWRGTPMLRYFQLTFPDDVLRIRSRILGTALASALPKGNNVQEGVSQSSHVKESQPKRKKGRPRKQSPPLVSPLSKTPACKITPSYSSLDEDDYGTPNVVTRKRKSILQPSGSKYSKKARKAAGRRSSTQDLAEPTTSDNGDGEDEGEEEKTLPAEQSPITTINNGDHLNLITNPPASRSSAGSSSPPQFLARKYLELKMVEYEVPSMEPQGPGDLWTCTFEGCFHRIYEASTTTSKMRIRDHFKTHKCQAQEKIDLALNESRPYLPVHNLVRRLQAFAPSLGEEVDLERVGGKFVAPIRRKY
ncbi:MAG: hypothetical protein Q9217_000356 [Psora testacea]